MVQHGAKMGQHSPNITPRWANMAPNIDSRWANVVPRWANIEVQEPQGFGEKMLRRDSDATSLATGESVSRVNSQHDPKTIQMDLMMGREAARGCQSLFRPSGSVSWIKFLFATLLCPLLAPAWPVLGEAHTIAEAKDLTVQATTSLTLLHGMAGLHGVAGFEGLAPKSGPGWREEARGGREARPTKSRESYRCFGPILDLCCPILRPRWPISDLCCGHVRGSVDPSWLYVGPSWRLSSLGSLLGHLGGHVPGPFLQVISLKKLNPAVLWHALSGRSMILLRCTPLVAVPSSLGHVVPMLGHPESRSWLCWPILELFWGYVDPSWVYVEAMLAHLSYVGAMLAHLGAMLGLCWPLCWGYVGPSWGHVGAMLAHLVAMLTHLGSMLGHLGG